MPQVLLYQEAWREQHLTGRLLHRRAQPAAHPAAVQALRKHLLQQVLLQEL
jgi:hypothetical protein